MPASAPRYVGLDVVRASAMGLGVAYHAALAYVPGIGRWYFLADAASAPAFAVVTGTLHSFRMQLFFAISGFFAHLLLERRGAAGFLRDRAARLLVPFFAALPLVLGAELATRRLALAQGLLSESYAPGVGFRAMPLHLWFLEYLFLYCALAFALTRCGVRGERASAGLARALALPAGWLWTSLGLALLSGLDLWLAPALRPALRFSVQPAAFLHYGGFFAFGWIAWAARDALPALAPRGAWLAAAGLLLAAAVAGTRMAYAPQGQFLFGAVPVLVTLGCVGVALRAWPPAPPWLRFLVDASYWVYLVHYPLVQGLQLLLAPLAWPALAKYAGVLGATLALALLSFAGFVRPTPLRWWLGARGLGAREGRGQPVPGGGG
jgi:peptidoglycan/LPS O-acetylase OafA/YrhL